ncbi:MAG TPA: ATP-binding cassette domain-containing protein, partial [Longimicrobiales bacterium]|nr:ATP-binding cassette domain-containing protein [Longimicrobiales bacterium]
AVDGVDLDVGEGECVALVGESGSGKTTLLRMFNRTVEPDAGSARWRGRDLAEMDPVTVRRETGFVQQEGGLLPHWPVLRNAALVPWLQGRDDAEARARAALDRVGLPSADFAHRWPRGLSGGQRQRVALARALAGDPEVILLDEPFGALDAITRADLQDLFAALVGDLGVTVLLVTHDLHEATLLGDRVAVLRDGRIEQVAAPEVLRSAPSGSYVADLLARSRLGSGAHGRSPDETRP